MMIKYSTSYLTRYVATNTLKDRLIYPMLQLIKLNIEKIQGYIQFQEKYR